ncbi:MAG: U32 family peptidase [Elusimicrobiota bacterium]
MKKPELLAPAGNLEKLKVAVKYGADAVYISDNRFGLRAAADNFTPDDMHEGIEHAHSQGARIYIAMNIIAHNEDFQGMEKYISRIYDIGADAVIVSDPGILMEVKKYAPEMPVILSTQANCTNLYSALFWHGMGVKRITLARELSIDQIQTIRQNIPDTLELEVFIHGALCMSYSGRCLLSSYMTGRDSNLGSCTHPCRWKYSLVEETRPGEYFPVYEDERGTSILSSRDLCMIEHVPLLMESGIDSFKIEGRMKSSYYVAVTTSVYREAIDQYISAPESYCLDPAWMEELQKVIHRDYTDGFLFRDNRHTMQVYKEDSYTRNYDYLGLVLKYDMDKKTAVIRQQNKIQRGDYIEIIGPGRKQYGQEITDIWNEEDEPVRTAPHAKQIVKMKMEYPVEPMDIIRKKTGVLNT